MRRRTYIGTLAVAGTGAVAGCGSLLNLGGPSKGPDEVAEEFIQALDDGDRERVQSLIHSDAGEFRASESEWDMWEGADIEIEGSEVVESGEDEAVADVTYGLDAGSGSVAGEETYRMTLRTEDGEWRVWDGESR